MAFNVGSFLGSLAPAALQGFEYVRKMREESERRARAEAMAVTLGEWLKSAGLDVRDPRVLIDAVAQLRAPDVIQIGKLVQETALARRQEEHQRRLAELLSGGIDTTGSPTPPPTPEPGARPLPDPTAGLNREAALGLSTVTPETAIPPDDMAALLSERDRLQRAMATAVQFGNIQAANLIERRLGDVEKALEAIDTRERTRRWFLEYAQRRQQMQAEGIRPEEAARVAAIDTSVHAGFLPPHLQHLFPTKETLDDAIRRYAEMASGGDPHKFLRAVGQAKALMLPPEQPSPEERARVAQMATLGANLRRVSELFRLEYIGPVAGRVRGLQERTVGLSTKESEFRSAVEQFKQTMITALTGAQRSYEEMQYLAQIFPDVTLPPSTFVGKLNQAIQHVYQALLETRELWRQSRIDTSHLDVVLEALSVRAHLTPDGRLALVKTAEPGSPPQIELPPRPQIDRPGSGLRP